MRALLYSLLLLTVGLLHPACHGVKKAASKPEIEAGQNRGFVPPVVKKAEAPPEQDLSGNILIARIARDTCYGMCPAYVAEVWSDGRAVWKGQAYVARMGNFEAKVSRQWIQLLLEEAAVSGVFQTDSYYPRGGNNMLTGVPAIHLSLTYGGRLFHCTDITDAPQEVKNFERFFEDQLEGLKWVKH